MSLVIIVMGVSGAGKSTVAQALASALHLRYFDADDFHSAASKEKMGHGQALTDDDRQPWLQSLTDAITQWQKDDQGAVLACSALKEAYRQQLMSGGRVKLIYLKADYQSIYDRLKHRANHYMKADMLKSQFATLEEPTNAIVIDASKSLALITQEAIGAVSQ